MMVYGEGMKQGKPKKKTYTRKSQQKMIIQATFILNPVKLRNNQAMKKTKQT